MTGLFEDALAAVLGRGSGVFCWTVPENDTFRTRIVVPDMVPALRQFRVDTDCFLIRQDGMTAVARNCADVVTVVFQERELRHWSQCDP